MFTRVVNLVNLPRAVFRGARGERKTLAKAEMGKLKWQREGGRRRSEMTGREEKACANDERFVNKTRRFINNFVLCPRLCARKANL